MIRLVEYVTVMVKRRGLPPITLCVGRENISLSQHKDRQVKLKAARQIYLWKLRMKCDG